MPSVHTTLLCQVIASVSCGFPRVFVGGRRRSFAGAATVLRPRRTPSLRGTEIVALYFTRAPASGCVPLRAARACRRPRCGSMILRYQEVTRRDEIAMIVARLRRCRALRAGLQAASPIEPRLLSHEECHDEAKPCHAVAAAACSRRCARRLGMAADRRRRSTSADRCPTPSAVKDGLFPEDACKELEASGFKCMGFKPAIRYSLPASSFKVGSAELPELLKKQLDVFADVLRTQARAPAGQVRVIGHADASGTAEANQALSLKRAEAVKDYLVQKGADADMLIAVGAGREGAEERRRPVRRRRTAASRSAAQRAAMTRAGAGSTTRPATAGPCLLRAYGNLLAWSGRRGDLDDAGPGAHQLRRVVERRHVRDHHRRRARHPRRAVLPARTASASADAERGRGAPRATAGWPGSCTCRTA